MRQIHLTSMNRLITSLENDKYVLGIYLDFPKAFDTLDHVILQKKSLSHTGGTRSQRGRLWPYYRSRLCPYQSVTCRVSRCNFFREEAYIVVNTSHVVVKFAHGINLISEELWWQLNIILNSTTQIKCDIPWFLLMTQNTFTNIKQNSLVWQWYDICIHYHFIVSFTIWYIIDP